MRCQSRDRPYRRRPALCPSAGRDRCHPIFFAVEREPGNGHGAESHAFKGPSASAWGGTISTLLFTQRRTTHRRRNTELERMISKGRSAPSQDTHHAQASLSHCLVGCGVMGGVCMGERGGGISERSANVGESCHGQSPYLLRAPLASLYH
jgi:hypothetical protein